MSSEINSTHPFIPCFNTKQFFCEEMKITLHGFTGIPGGPKNLKDFFLYPKLIIKLHV